MACMDVSACSANYTSLSAPASTVRQPAENENTGHPGDTFAVDALQQSLASARKAVYFWGSLAATVVPGYFGRKVGLTENFHHWNFITDHLILGAIPVVTRVGESGNHLAQLQSQLAQRGLKLGLVVACMEEVEIRGFGVSVITFADKVAWRQHVGPELEYLHLPMADGTSDAPFDDVASAVDKMHLRILEKKAVYVHCKAGKGRSWMVTVCYLTTYGGMTFQDACDMVSAIRVQVKPSESQRAFAEAFARRMSQRGIVS
ncbi:Dual specificity phosphatase catalytic domain [Trypanosoma vivax]|nr:hypothetical protein TRVL_01029 [Trypanosoma vivax]KAH8618996.1 Dual specificity phosphatase catalytic domain [Trypanosoma vivax]